MPSHNKLQMSKADRLWTRVKWSTRSQRQRIDKFMIRIEFHCKTFTMTLLLLNTSVSSRIAHPISDLSIKPDLNSRLGLRSSIEALQHSEIINLPTIHSKRKPIALDSHKSQRSTRCSRASDVLASTYGRSALKISSISRAKRGNLLGAQHISYQGPHKITKIRKAVATPASCNTSLFRYCKHLRHILLNHGVAEKGPDFQKEKSYPFE